MKVSVLKKHKALLNPPSHKHDKASQHQVLSPNSRETVNREYCGGAADKFPVIDGRRLGLSIRETPQPYIFLFVGTVVETKPLLAVFRLRHRTDATHTRHKATRWCTSCVGLSVIRGDTWYQWHVNLYEQWNHHQQDDFELGFCVFLGFILFRNISGDTTSFIYGINVKGVWRRCRMLLSNVLTWLGDIHAEKFFVNHLLESIFSQTLTSNFMITHLPESYPCPE